MSFKVVMGCTINGEETEFSGFRTKGEAQEFVAESKEMDASGGNESWFLYSIQPIKN